MLCPHIETILLLIAIWHFATNIEGATCGNELCNHEAACQMRAGKPFCQCIGTKYFRGEFCNEEVNNCEPNPCQNGARCRNALGQAVCGPCAGGYGGQLCNVQKPNLFTGMYLHHNRYGYQSIEQRFLLTVENLGDTAFITELYAPNYAIDIIKTDPKKNGKKWRRSRDLRTTAREYGLRHHNKMPYNSGYFYVSSGRFWKTGLQTVLLKISDADTLDPYFEAEFAVLILKKDDSCVPELELVHCDDPFNPLLLDVARFQIFQPIVKNRCSESSELRFEWAVYNSIETALLHSYGHTDVPRLKIPPYASWYRFKGEVIQVSMIHISLTEVVETELMYTVSRCYVMVQMKPIAARIVGGTEREIDATSSIWLDGSKSRDLSLPPNVKSKLNFQWSCKSQDDAGNAYCSQLKGKTGKLQQGKTYTISLQASSPANQGGTNIATQDLKVMTARALWIDIECVRNCELQKFTPNKMLHLKAICVNCVAHSAQSYEWTVNDAQAAATARVVVENAADIGGVLTARVRIESGGHVGSAALQLKRNPPPAGGSCKIEPGKGVEYETEFSIACDRFTDDDLPFYYEFKVGSFLLDRSTAPTVRLHLPETNQIEVNVCDALGSCAESSIAVSVTALKVPDNVRAFLAQKQTNLRELVADNDWGRAIVLVHRLSRAVKGANAVFVCEQLRKTDLHSCVGLEQLTQVIGNFVQALKPLTHEDARALTLLLQHTVHAYETILIDGEVREIEIHTFRSLTEITTLLLESMTNEAEKLPRPQTIQPEHVNTYDRISESYPDFAVFDPKILMRINDWLQFNTQLNRNINLLGFVAANVHRPTEPIVVVQQPDVIWESYEFEETASLNVNTQDGVAQVLADSANIQEIQAKRRSKEIVRQVVSTVKNPFWWYPTAFELDTGVLYFTTFDQKFLSDTSSDLQLKRRITFTLQLNDPSELSKGEPAFGRISSNEDMNIFHFKVPVDALLVVEFLSTDIKLRVVLIIGGVPTGRLTHKSKRLIEPEDMTDILFILNTKKKTTNAYLGVVPGEGVSKDAYFSFTAVLRKCISWTYNLKNPQWTTVGCRPEEDASIADGFRCFCEHLSIFAGEVTTTPAYSLYNVGHILDKLPMNWSQVAHNLMLALVSFFWVVFAYLALDANRENLVTAPKDPGAVTQDNESDEVVIHLTTGGYRNASTTAGVMITLKTISGLQKFKIYQNPQRPHLSRNSTCTLRVPLSSHFLQKPISVIIRQDGGGRYPTWYCQAAEINYVGAKKPAVLKVNHWIATKAIHISEIDDGHLSTPSAQQQQYQQQLSTPPTNEKKPSSPIRVKLSQFGENLETLFVNWFQFQPLLGPWKYGNQTCNRFERTLVWLCKTALSILIVTYYFGWTTLDNYEGERRLYQRVGTNLVSLLVLSIVCFLVGAAVQFALEYWMLRISKKDYGIVV